MEARRIDFIKIAGRWFPVFREYEGSIDDLEIVDESAKFLDKLYKKGFERNGLVSVIVSDEKLPVNDIVLERCENLLDENEVGMYYKYDDKISLWFCPVLYDYFEGNYPEKIYINILYKNLKTYVS